MRAFTFRCLAAIITLSLSAVPAIAGSFSFYSTLRAGSPGTGDWEVGAGRDSTASDSTGSFRWSSTDPGWRSGNLSQNFEIGFRSSTQTAYVTVWNQAGVPTTVLLANTGAALSANAIWTFPAANFFVSASNTSQPSSINVENLTLSPGVQVLGGALPTSLGAAQPPSTTTPMTAPLVIKAASSGGNWFISGTIRFAGIVSTGGSAKGSDLRFLLNASGTDNPEPVTVVITAIGLVLVQICRRSQQRICG